MVGAKDAFCIDVDPELLSQGDPPNPSGVAVGVDEGDLPALEEAGRRLAAAWTAALAARFPDRRFTVEFATEPDEYGPTVSFHQSADCPGCSSSA